MFLKMVGEYGPRFLCPLYKSFENTVGKGEIACNTAISPFPAVYLPVWRTFCHFYQILNLSSANSFSSEESKICRLRKG